MFVELCHGALLHKPVGDADTMHDGLQSVFVDAFHHCSAETSGDAAVFNGDDVLELRCHILYQLFVERLQKHHVVVGCAYAVFLGGVDGSCRIVADGAERQHGDVVAVFKHSSLCQSVCSHLPRG